MGTGVEYGTFIVIIAAIVIYAVALAIADHKKKDD